MWLWSGVFKGVLLIDKEVANGKIKKSSAKKPLDI